MLSWGQGCHASPGCSYRVACITRFSEAMAVRPSFSLTLTAAAGWGAISITQHRHPRPLTRHPCLRELDLDPKSWPTRRPDEVPFPTNMFRKSTLAPKPHKCRIYRRSRACHGAPGRDVYKSRYTLLPNRRRNDDGGTPEIALICLAMCA